MELLLTTEVSVSYDKESTCVCLPAVWCQREGGCH